jgi:hypothetical protein
VTCGTQLLTCIQALQAAKDAGFKVLHHEDIAHHPSCEVKWYATLKSGRLLHWMRDCALTAAEAIRLVPRGTAEIHRMLTKTAAALVSGGEQVRSFAPPLPPCELLLHTLLASR